MIAVLASGVETLEEFDDSRLRWRSLTSAWTFPVSRSIPANRLSVPAPRSRGRRAWAANRVLWLRWPGFPAFRLGNSTGYKPLAPISHEPMSRMTWSLPIVVSWPASLASPPPRNGAAASVRQRPGTASRRKHDASRNANHCHFLSLPTSIGSSGGRLLNQPDDIPINDGHPDKCSGEVADR